MAFTNRETKEINCKIIYFGSRGSGKTSNLRSILEASSTEVDAGMVEMGALPGPSKYFDFLPVSVGHVRDYQLKLHLFTMSPNSLYPSVEEILTSGLDGFVFVANSEVPAMPDNLEALEFMKQKLQQVTDAPQELPAILQFNKRDSAEVFPTEILNQHLNLHDWKTIDAVAANKIGTLETLQQMTSQIIEKIGATAC